MTKTIRRWRRAKKRPQPLTTCMGNNTKKVPPWALAQQENHEDKGDCIARWRRGEWWCTWVMASCNNKKKHHNH